MALHVRLSGGLARCIGQPRLVVTLEDGATVAELLDHLRRQHPSLVEGLAAAIPMVGGRHASPDEPLRSGQEIALLMPVAGGAP